MSSSASDSDSKNISPSSSLVWKTIEEFPNYEISDKGQVRNKTTQRILTVSPLNGGLHLQNTTQKRCMSLTKLMRIYFPSDSLDEEWRVITDKYECSNRGNIRHRIHKNVLLCKSNAARLRSHIRGKQQYVDELIAEAFLGPKPSPNHIVNHKNGNQSDNSCENLEWLCRAESPSDDEQWKIIPIEDCSYEASNMGRIRNSNKWVMSPIICQGYLQLSLTMDGSPKQWKIHRLVAMTWIPNPEEKACINHINSNKLDNRVANLEWVTHSENNYHRRKIKKAERVILQYSLDGKFMKEYSSWSEIHKELGISRSAITACCDRNGQSHGFCWKWKEEKPRLDLTNFVEIVEAPNYLISRSGDIYSKVCRKLLSLGTDGHGYRYATLSTATGNVTRRAHRLVAIAFIPNPFSLPVVNHKDNNPNNNQVDNLEWVTQAENVRAARKTGK